MKRLVIMNDCDGCASIEVMKEAHALFESYGIPFSDSCWAFNMRWRGGFVSLLNVNTVNEKQVVTRKYPDYDYLTGMLTAGEVDTLHTWGDFPYGGFTRELLEQAMPMLREVRFTAWTAHGGTNDLQNLAPLGRGDLPGDYYHLDYCHQLGIQFWGRHLDMKYPSKRTIRVDEFRRFRGPTKIQVYSISLADLPLQIRMAEHNSILHRSPDTVILATHLYTEPDPTRPEGWRSVEHIKVTPETDECLRKLADRMERGELEIMRFSALVLK